MTVRQRAATRPTVRLALASTMLAGGALFGAGPATAEPVPMVPVDPGAPPPPGQPVVMNPDELVAAPPAPPPAGPPPVPEMSNPAYGGGQSGGTFGYIRDLWNAAKSPDPMAAFSEAGQGGLPGGPPPGAGPAPKLPPGYTSLTDPSSSTPSLRVEGTPQAGGPPLPPGFVSLSDPNPPPEVLPIGAPGAAPADVPAPGAPVPPPGPAPAPLPPTIIQQGPLN